MIYAYDQRNAKVKEIARAQEALRSVLIQRSAPVSPGAEGIFRMLEGVDGGFGVKRVGMSARALYEVATAVRTDARQAGVAAFHNCSFREAKASFERMRDTARAAGLGREEGQASRLLANALDKLVAPEADAWLCFLSLISLVHD